MADNFSSPCSSTLILIKRTRTCGNKVRTGCITCKVRHVKCDEAKPACQRCISTARVCDGYVPVAPRQFHRHSRSTSEAKSRSHSPLPPTSSPQFFSSNDITPFGTYPFTISDVASELWDDSIIGSSCGSLTATSSISSPFFSPSTSDLDSLDSVFDDKYLAPPPQHHSRSSQPRSSPSPSLANFEANSKLFPQLLVLTSLDHAKQEFSSILQQSATLIHITQVALHMSLSSRLHQFRSAFDNYEIFNSTFYSPSDLLTAKTLRINTLSFFIYLATFLDNAIRYETFDHEFEKIVRICEEVVADGAGEREWVASLRQVAMCCRDRGVKRRAVLLLSCCTTR